MQKENDDYGKLLVENIEKEIKQREVVEKLLSTNLPTGYFRRRSRGGTFNSKRGGASESVTQD